jgi:hypothetical protein
MKIEKIEFTQGEEGALPNVIVVSMTLAEAVWIAQKAGNERGGYPTTHDIYMALNADVFNRYWENGVEGAAASTPNPSVHPSDGASPAVSGATRCSVSK